jgi:aryl-alcohol dehydrogenase-like predicted oxidoreductase
MQLRKLGQSDIHISPIVMGLWQAGKEMWVGIDDKETTKAIRAAFEADITTFDTAEAYGKGHSERILASAISEVRDKVIYATKVFSNHLKFDQVLEACHRLLKNLQSDFKILIANQRRVFEIRRSDSRVYAQRPSIDRHLSL